MFDSKPSDFRVACSVAVYADDVYVFVAGIVFEGEGFVGRPCEKDVFRFFGHVFNEELVGSTVGFGATFESAAPPEPVSVHLVEGAEDDGELEVFVHNVQDIIERLVEPGDVALGVIVGDDAVEDFCVFLMPVVGAAVLAEPVVVEGNHGARFVGGFGGEFVGDAFVRIFVDKEVKVGAMYARVVADYVFDVGCSGIVDTDHIFAVAKRKLLAEHDLVGFPADAVEVEEEVVGLL